MRRTATTRSFDHIILLGYRSGVTPAEADARTLLTLLQLPRCLDRSDGTPRIVAELLDSRDVELGRVTAADDLIVSDVLSSLAMAQLSERPELDAVFTDLFDTEGSSITLRPATAYIRDGRHPSRRTSPPRARTARSRSATDSRPAGARRLRRRAQPAQVDADRGRCRRAAGRPEHAPLTPPLRSTDA